MVQKSCQPVEVGSLSQYLRQVFYIPDADRRISWTKKNVCHLYAGLALASQQAVVGGSGQSDIWF